MRKPKFFRFRETRYWRGSCPVVGIAPSEVIEKFVSKEELCAEFGGYLEYEDFRKRHRYRGVWGDRKVGRLRRLLMERGAQLEIKETEPDRFRQRHRTVSYGEEVPSSFRVQIG